MKTKIIPTDYECAQEIEETILDDVSGAGFAEADMFAIRLATEEAFANAIKHGNERDENKKLAISWECSAGEVTIVVADEGNGFTPDDVPDPTEHENLERSFGRGIMLIRSYMDEVVYNEKGNKLTMKKRSGGNTA